MSDPRNFYFPDATPADFDSEGFKAMASSTVEDDGKNHVLIESFANRELVTFALYLFPRRDSLPNVLARRIASLVDLLAKESGYNDDLAKHLDEAQAEIERLRLVIEHPSFARKHGLDDDRE